MTVNTDQVAQQVYDAYRQHSMATERSIQQSEHLTGASELGHCRSYLVHMLGETPYDESDDPKWAAFVGTAVGDRLEEAFISEVPGALKQVSAVATFPSGRTVPCHIDNVHVEGNYIIDHKGKDGLAFVKAEKEPSRRHRFQIGTYTLALIQAGILKPGAQAFLVYHDRSGKEPFPHAVEVVVDDALIAEIDDFVDDAIYAHIHKVEAPKDQPYAFCENYCQFFSSCRGGESLASGLIEDEEAKLALKLYLEGAAQEKEGAALKRQGQAVLRQREGVIASDDGLYEISQTVVAATSFVTNRDESVRLNVRKQKPAKGSAVASVQP